MFLFFSICLIVIFSVPIVYNWENHIVFRVKLGERLDKLDNCVISLPPPWRANRITFKEYFISERKIIRGYREKKVNIGFYRIRITFVDMTSWIIVVYHNFTLTSWFFLLFLTGGETWLLSEYLVSGPQTKLHQEEEASARVKQKAEINQKTKRQVWAHRKGCCCDLFLIIEFWSQNIWGTGFSKIFARSLV